MLISNFIERLKQIPLNKQEYIKIGYDKDFIEEIYSGFNLVQINNSTIKESKILELIANYDLSNFEIGAIRFNLKEEVLVDGDYYYFGQFDADTLVLDKGTREIVILDYSNYKEKLWDCALNEENFLNALLLAAKYLEHNSILEKVSFDNLKNQVIECSDIAGGIKYRSFYETLLGLE